MNSIKRWLADHLSQSFLGTVDYYTRSEKLDNGVEPFNGQRLRQMIFLELVRACQFDAIVETGTFRGITTRFLARNSGGAPVYTAEINKRFFGFARQRLWTIPHVRMYNIDSRNFLSTITLSGNGCKFFYLDAHWLEDLPLAGEIDLIARRFPSFVIMIDDFQVPDDPGYGYDDYGPGKSLSLRDFPFDSVPRFVPYFPAGRSAADSGVRRGSIVLASPDLKDKVDSLACLRRFGMKTRSASDA